MSLKKKTWWLITAIGISLIAGIIIGIFISGKSFGRRLFLTPNNKINVVLDIINEDYVDPANMKDLTENAITNIINGLDPHSSYIPSSELQAVNNDMEGHFGGLGMEYFIYQDTIVVVSVTHGSPSSQAGLLAGDRIVQVDDSSFIGKNITEEKAINTLRGPVGTSVKLGIKRDNSDKLLEYSLIRGNILLTTVKAAYQIDNGIGFIKIYDKFSHTTYDEFMHAITKLMAEGCKSFIIDLRMNGGGTLEAAIKIINEFLPAGRMIVYAEGKSFPRNQFISDGSGNLQENQIVILMDQLSASASEIVAGAIQDNDRGLIIGRRSFGKGLVQDQIELSDGSAVRLTIARYFTPSGRNIQRKYELGKTEEYNQEWINQLNSAESFHAGSMKVDTTLAYQTLHGRTVYGGGGIQPDIFVPTDTAHLTTYYINLENKGIFNQFAFEYWLKNREQLKKYKDAASLLIHLRQQFLLPEIIQCAEQNGVRKRTYLISRSANQILLTTYACILRNFFGEDSFYPVYLSADPMIAKAIEAIRKSDTTPEAVAAMKYKELK
ncbi:peptidase S41 [Bacteroidia bacterium]|nr:peptidase S41 [Bacteroidia bacterium]